MATIPQRRERQDHDERLPWLEARNVPGRPAARPSSGGSGMRWFVSLLILALVAAGAFVLGRGSDLVRHAAQPVAVSLPPAQSVSRPSAPAPIAPAASAPVPLSATPPALARVAETNQSPVRIVAHPQRVVEPRPASGLHLSNDQMRAVRKIARDAAVAVHRNEPSGAGARFLPVRSATAPRLGPSGRVVQLGAYRTSREAEAAAQLFRYKYRGLLAPLPKAVLPFKPRGTTRLFYRVQFITPSQAYSEVTCQRLRAAAKTCIVIY